MNLFIYTEAQSSNQNLRRSFVINLILIACLLFFALHQSATAETVHIPDLHLRTALELALGKAAGDDITQADMASLQSLQASRCRFMMLSEIKSWGYPKRWICQSNTGPLIFSVQDLTGIEFAINLKELHLGRNRISDISPLRNLKKLTYLDLGLNGRISDISPLKNLENLTHLSLRYNEISDVSPLKDLTNLFDLDLYDNQISDVSPLKDLTENLMFLDLGLNDWITDISSLKDLTKLTFLSLRYNQISDLSPLKDLTNLIGLNLQHNQISDVSPLRDLSKLRHLDIDSNQISDISPLRGLTELRLLDISDNNISNVSSLEDMRYLSWLDIDDNKVSDITALKDLTTLRELDLDDNEIVDIAPLKDMVHLRWLDLDDNNISDISPLSNLIKLTVLDLDGNNISDVSPLKNLTNLTELDLDGNQISAISSLSSLTNLTVLDLHDNQISDISHLSGLINLTDLDLDGNRILDVSSLSSLINLNILDLHDNLISNISPLSGLINLIVLDLSNNQISDFTPLAGLVENLQEYSTGNQTIPTYKPEDVNRDGAVNIKDLVLIASNFHDPDLKTLAQINIYPDVNGDDVVDIIDLLTVTSEIGTTDDAAPIVTNNLVGISSFTVAQLTQWIRLAKRLETKEPHLQRGIAILEHLLELLRTVEPLPKKTALLQNYPNPFNPETWIPYQLAKPAKVFIFIYSASGTPLRKLELGELTSGVYQHKSRAAYWDGRNDLGETVASGVYFYTFIAGDFTATGKMLIRK